MPLIVIVVIHARQVLARRRLRLHALGGPHHVEDAGRSTQTEEHHHQEGRRAQQAVEPPADEKPDSDARDQLDTEPERLAERGALARRRLRVSRPMPALGLAELFAKGVEPPPNFVGSRGRLLCGRTDFRLRPLALLNFREGL